MAEYIPVKIQRLVLKASNGYCEYCWSPSDYTSAIYHFDHILPVVKGGKSLFANLAYSCNACNSYKSDRTHYLDSMTQQVCRLYHPRKDKWADHFQWSEDGLRIDSITPIGRVTVALLQMNRTSTMNLRQILQLVGLHPPVLSLLS
jgi:HNH endonuclease